MTKILGSLPLKFRSFRQAWLSLDETKQTIQNLTSRLLDEDTSLSTSDSTEVALATSSNVDKSVTQKGNEQRSKLDKSKIICYKCQKKGHFAKECRGERRFRNQEQQNTQHKPHQNSQQGNYSAFNVQETNVNKTSSILENEIWIFDSGATSHMTYRRESLFDFQEINDNIFVVLGNGQELAIKGKSNVKIKKLVNNKWIEAVIVDVLYVPNLNKNLFSEGVITKRGMKIVKKGIYANIFENNMLTASAIRKENNLYHMQFQTVVVQEANVVTKESLRRWHERLGHLNIKSIKDMVSKSLISGIELTDVEKFFCESCMYGKQHKLYFTPSKHIKAKPGELIYSDRCGPMSVPSVQGAKYFVLFKDDLSGYKVVFFIKHKSDTLECFKEFNRLAKNKFGNSVKILHVDNGGEYCNEDFRAYLSQCGIILETTAPSTPEQNGRAEREMRTIVESARSMLYAKDVPLYLWAEAVNTAVYILNRTATSQAPNSTPYELWTGKKPALDHIRTFGCEAFLHIPKEQRNKLAAKSKKLMLVGYDKNSTNYRLYDIETKKIKVSRNVIFNENATVSKERKNTAKIIFENGTDEAQCEPPGRNHDRNVHFQEENQLEDSQQQDVLDEENSTMEYNLRSRDKIRRPQRYEAHYADIQIPESYKEAITSCKNKEWREAIQEEINALTRNKTWEETHLPQGKEAISSRWVFNIKQKPNGEITRFKARLCAKGFAQKEGIDFTDTFSPTVRYDSIRILLAIAVQREYEIMQFDVKTAFLNGELKEDVYMLPPEGIAVKSGMVCKLNKALYSLKQAFRGCWNQRFDAFLKDIGFIQSDADKCVYQGTFNKSIILLALYVDDGLIMGSDKKILQNIISKLRTSFEITASTVGCFVGMEIIHDKNKDSIFVNQKNYIRRIIKKFNMEDAKTVSTPADIHVHLSLDSNNGTKIREKQKVPYREAVGSLMFAAIVSRPDIAFSVGVASRYLDKYDETHWNAIKRIFKYLKETDHYGIMYTKNNAPNILKGYSDSDFASDTDTRRSTTGYIFKLSNGPVTWNSQRQSTVSLSTTEAEYIAASCAAREAVWIRQLLRDVKESLNEPTPLFIDNQSAIKLIRNAEFHKRTKHMSHPSPLYTRKIKLWRHRRSLCL